MLLLYLAVDVGHLFHLQLAGQHHHVGKLRIELQRLDVRYVQLRGEVYLHTHLAAVGHHGNVAGDDSRNLRLYGSVHYLVHRLDVLTIDNGVHREVRLHACLVARCGNLAQVVNGEVVGRVRAHVQLLHSEIYRPCTSLQRCCQRVAAAHRSHYFIVCYLIHAAKVRISERNAKFI